MENQITRSMHMCWLFQKDRKKPLVMGKRAMVALGFKTD